MTHARSGSEVALVSPVRPRWRRSMPRNDSGACDVSMICPGTPRAESSNVSLCRFDIRNDASAVDLPVPYTISRTPANGCCRQQPRP